MTITIDDKSGFCFGVVTAITKAEESLAGGRKVYSLGDIVHNRVEVQRLEDLGLVSVGIDQMERLRGETFLIRAHGEPPTTYTKAEQCGVHVIDATCPVVAMLQRSVAKAYRQMEQVGGQVVILGKRGHAEVVGLIGQVDGKAIVVESVADLDAVNFSRPIYLLSQTTQSLTLFEQVKNEILLRSADPADVVIKDTICRQVANREPHLREFSKSFDVVVFVSGKKSSNGKVLYQVCSESNPRSYNVEDESELQAEWFENCEKIGICGATSTPKWLMNRVAEAIEQMVAQE